MDTQKLRQLLDQREAIDAEIVSIVNGNGKRKPQVCSVCNQEGHSARTCTMKNPVNV